MKQKRKATIDELERILNSEEQAHIHIMPDGSIRTKKTRQRNAPEPKVLTMKQALGGEY